MDWDLNLSIWLELQNHTAAQGRDNSEFRPVYLAFVQSGLENLQKQKPHSLPR